MTGRTKCALLLKRALCLVPVLVFALCATGIAAYAAEPAASSGIIYLDGQNGSDSRDGLTKATAVRTFAKAKEMATADHSIKTIMVTGCVRTDGELSLEGTDAILKRDPSYSGYVLEANWNSNTVLKNITIDGSKDALDPSLRSCSALFHARDTTTLTIAEGTVLRNNKTFGAEYSGGGAIESLQSKVTMTGGTIENNESDWGGGILVNSSTFEMSGGTIRNNAATCPAGASKPAEHGYGGGICSWNGDPRRTSTITLTGGTIENNTSAEAGGGISLGVQLLSGSGITLNMTGGEVLNNKSGACGGGIFVQGGWHPGWQSVANISGGRIAGNRMESTGVGNTLFGGGGIYVNGANAAPFVNGELHLKDAIVRNNTAEQEGGALAACPISDVRIYVREGAALYGNHANAANEIYILASLMLGVHSGDPSYEISPLMLGGVPYKWVGADGKEVPLNTLSGTLSAARNETIQLSTDQTGNAATEALGHAIIENNWSATKGGGIGTNGTVIVGVPDKIDIPVEKLWEGFEGYDVTFPESVRVDLYAKAKGTQDEPAYVGYETIKPDADGAWKLVFKNLPKTDSQGRELEYSVQEEKGSFYVAKVSGDQTSGFEIKNLPVVKLDVEKVWKGVDAASAPAVTVRLFCNGGPTEQTVVLDADNGWKASFEQLPLFTQNIRNRYTAVEEGEEGGKIVLGGKTYEVTYDRGTITNTLVEQPPSEEKPPSEGQPPSDEKPPTPRTPKGDVPDTGDPAAALALVSALLAAGGAASLFASRKVS